MRLPLPASHRDPLIASFSNLFIILTFPGLGTISIQFRKHVLYTCSIWAQKMLRWPWMLVNHFLVKFSLSFFFFGFYNTFLSSSYIVCWLIFSSHCFLTRTWKDTDERNWRWHNQMERFGLEELILLKWSYYPRQSTESMQSLLKCQWHFSQN